MALDFELSEEHLAVQEAMRNCLEPFSGRREELTRMVLKEKRFPEELWQAICATGLLGTVIPEEYGGNGMGLLSMVLGVEELARHGFGNALLILTAMDACCILRGGSEEMKRRYLPKMATGELKFGFAITEPNAGSNAFRLETLARQEGDEYVINGEKVFITGADVADRILLICRTTSRKRIDELGMPKAFGLALFVIDPKAPGITLSPIPTRGIEGMTQFTVHMEDVRVPASELVGDKDMGGMVMFNSLNPERILAAAAACGITSKCIDQAVSYAKERKVFKDRPIGAYQAMSHPLAKSRIDLDAVRLLTYRAAWAFDQDMHPGRVGTYANMAKYAASEMAIAAVDRAIQVHGGYGFSEEYGLIYYYETVRLLRTAPITSELILNFIAEHELGLPRSY
ncbi:MAG TPA: acyl-CoA dehydrogenase family protein [Myxococcota bacterium]|nr:acyl-CoA dehydrogenase family protein [Myxococcota bacterium]